MAWRIWAAVGVVPNLLSGVIAREHVEFVQREDGAAGRRGIGGDGA